MAFASTIPDSNPARADLRLAVLAQWVRAGLGMIRGAATTGRGLVGGAVALWRVAQAVRLALLLAGRLAEARRATGQVAPASTPGPAWPLQDQPAAADALRRALAELAAAISDALGVARRRRLSLWDREPPGSPFLDRIAPCDRRASLAARDPGRRPHGRRPLRPPGPARPCRRSPRAPNAVETAPPPIATLAVGRDPLA